MSFLDPATMSAMTALVVTVCGVIFLLDTVMHAGSDAARTWSVAFMAGILTVFSYLAWTVLEDGWVAAAVGNAAFITTTGTMWLGCRRYNRRPMRISVMVVCAVAIATLVATLIPGPDGGDWAGAEVMFVALAAFSGLGAAEAGRTPLARQPGSLGLAIVLGCQCLFYLGRIVVFFTVGTDNAIFQDWFGTASASLITITLTITVVITISVLRATERGARRSGPSEALLLSDDGFLDAESFSRVVGAFLERVSPRNALAVVVLRLEDIDQIGAAFGGHQTRVLSAAARQAVKDAAPPAAFFGAAGSRSILIGLPGVPPDGVRAQVARLGHRVMDDLCAIPNTIVPLMGVGAAISTTPADELDALLDAADAAARESADNLGAAVVTGP